MFDIIQIPRRITKFLVCVHLLFYSIALISQGHPAYIQVNGPQSNIQDNKLSVPDEDTSLFHSVFIRLSGEIAKRGYLNLDTVRLYGNLSIAYSKQANYTPGLIRTYIGLGWGYVEKNEIDSSLNYYTLALEYASAIHDTSLLIQTYLNYGWALLYKPQNEEAIESALTAYQLATIIKDTASLIPVTSKLGRIYSLTGHSFNAYKSYTESINLCKIWNDTNALMRNYFLIGNLYASTNLYQKQKAIVYEALQFEKFIKDPETLYNLYYLASNWYGAQEQYDSMLYYSRMISPVAKKLYRIPFGLARIATVFLARDQLDSAKFYLELLLKEQKLYETFIEPHQYLDLGRIELQLGNHSKALEYYKIAESQSNHSDLFVRQSVYRALYEFYDSFHQFTNAYTYLKRHTLLTDSIFNFQNELKTGISVLELESAKLEEQIDLLSDNNKLQVALATKQRQQKNMVYGSAVFLMILAILGFIRYSRQREIKNKQALLTERLRISRELHDEVGATLSGIAMYSHVAKEQVKSSKHAEAENSISFMQKSAGEMVNKLSDIVWLINPEQDTILEMMGRLGEYGKQMTVAQNMQMKVDVPPELASIHVPLEVRRNIYLIFKEAINNAVKYSHGRFVEFRVKMHGAQIVFSVMDDGNGFELASVVRGNGLTNMQIRADEIGAKLQVESSPYTGSSINLHYRIIH